MGSSEVDVASAKAQQTTMTSPDGVTTDITRVPLRDVFCTKCGVSVGEEGAEKDHDCAADKTYPADRNNSRGFSRGEYVTVRKGQGRWRLRESSLATEPALWLDLSEPKDRNEAARASFTGDEIDFEEDYTIQLVARDARLLRDALDEMLRNHYHGDASSPNEELEDEDTIN